MNTKQLWPSCDNPWMVHLVHEYNIMAIQGQSMDGPPGKIVQEYHVRVHVHVAMAIQGQSVKGLQ